VGVRIGLLLADDPWLARRLDRLGGEQQLTWITEVPAVPPAAVVVDLGSDSALADVRDLRNRWPTVLLAGYLAVPDQERWLAGQRAGCDLVANRGALAARLRPLLGDGGRGSRLFPILAEADLAGRLGLVARVSDTPVGPVAVYQVEGELFVLADTCPHAGALLSEGPLDGSVITCPLHGSQFEVRNGERVRGPADTMIRGFRAVTSGGQVSIAVD
jgi:nitrite reductase/ring-hydroxylating ferredoxin subunit